MIYLDNAATSGKKPQEVINAVRDAVIYYSANPGRSGHDLSVKASEKVYETREFLNKFFNGYGSENVSFTLNCTEALNIAIKGTLKKGDHAVISCFEHNSVLRPLESLKRKGIIDYSVFDMGKTSEETVRNFKASLRENTSICIVTAVSNVFGCILPLKDLSDEAHRNNILFFVDGAQGAGVIPIDMKNTGIDCLAVPGHKGLLGPMGTGAILHKNLSFNTIIEGGTGTSSFSPLQPTEYPERLESGTLNVPGICGLGAGLKFIDKYGLNQIYHKESELCKYFYNNALYIPNITVYCKKYDEKIQAPVLSLNVGNLHSEVVASKLNEQGIAVRGGFHCSGLAHKFMGTNAQGTVRISPSFMNTKKDINFLLNLLEKFAIIKYI